MQKDLGFDTSVLDFFRESKESKKLKLGEKMLWYLLVIPATIWALAIIEPQNGGFKKVIDNSPVYEKGVDLYQHSDGGLFKSDWANGEDDL